MVSPRRRQPLRLVMVLSSLLGAAAGGGALVLVLMSARPPTIRVDVEAPDVDVTVPDPSQEYLNEEADEGEEEAAEPEAPAYDVEHPVLRGCVADPEMVGVPVEAGLPVHTVQPIVGVVASGCAIAAYSYSNLHVSRDDGTTFDEVLTSEETVGDVAIAADGTVYALREAGILGNARPDGTEVYRELPAEMSRLVAGGRWLAGIAGTSVAVSSDGAQTWRFLPLPAGTAADPDAMDVSIEPDGTVRVVALGDNATILRVARPGREWRVVSRWVASRRNVLLPDGGVASQLGDTAWEIHRGHTVRVLAAVDAIVASSSDLLVGDAGSPWRDVGELAAVDPGGNPLLVADGEGDLLRWSPRGGARVLLAATSMAE